MLSSIFNRKLVAILLVVVGGLLVATLYKMQVLSEVVQQQGLGSRVFKFFGTEPFGAAMAKATTTSTTSVPLLQSKDEQVKMANMLHKMLIKDPIEHKCKDVKLLKNRVEGEWKYCWDPDFVLKPPCLVYSFGIAYDFTFDDALGNLGCEVFSFDPSMDTADHRRNSHVMFYQTGLSGEDTDTFEPHLSSYVKKKTTWKMRTLKTLMKELGHSDRIIDLLKIDIETSEWPTVRNLISTGVLNQVKQFLVEWHVFDTYPAKEEFLRLVKVLQDLRQVGFLAYDKHPHPVNMNWDKFNLQSDFGYINMHFINSSRH